jgi:hypothetical protein
MFNRILYGLPTFTSWLLVALFVYTAADKLANRLQFERVMSVSPLIGEKSAWLSWLIPVSEGLIACLLVLPELRRLGLTFSFTLLLLFTLYITYMLLFAPRLPCGCGGFIAGFSWKGHLVFNLGFTVLTGLSLLVNGRRHDFIAINRRSRKPV